MAETTERRRLTARDVMHTEMLTVSRNTALSEIERLLGEHRIGGVPVTDEAGHILGIVSMRDLLERYSQDPDTRPGRGSFRVSEQDLNTSDGDDDLDFDRPASGEDTAADIMNADVHSVTPDTRADEVARTMIERRIHRVLVEEKGRYIGLITSFDLLRALTD